MGKAPLSLTLLLPHLCTMKTLWTSLASFFNPQTEQTARTDNTVYQIETSVGKYCGRIIYQDDVCMRLRCAKSKPVKILKVNIARITIVKSETVEQYQQWLSARPGLTI